MTAVDLFGQGIEAILLKEVAGVLYTYGREWNCCFDTCVSVVEHKVLVRTEGLIVLVLIENVNGFYRRHVDYSNWTFCYKE